MEEIPSLNLPVQRLKVSILLLDLPCSGSVTHSGEILTTGILTERDFWIRETGTAQQVAKQVAQKETQKVAQVAKQVAQKVSQKVAQQVAQLHERYIIYYYSYYEKNVTDCLKTHSVAQPNCP